MPRFQHRRYCAPYAHANVRSQKRSTEDRFDYADAESSKRELLSPPPLDRSHGLPEGRDTKRCGGTVVALVDIRRRKVVNIDVSARIKPEVICIVFVRMHVESWGPHSCRF